VWARALGDISSSPVIRGGRVYVGTDGGVIHSLDALDPAVNPRSFTPAPADGPVKGFLFPDRRNDDLIFATNTKVWSISDDTAPMSKNWEWSPPSANPNLSIVLYRPGTNFVYVGNKNGELYELDFTSADLGTAPLHKLQVLGGGQGQVGAPSLDIGTTPKPLLLVGSEPGVIHAVEVPFP
jgi:outer membrane protein assembly factor BamB